MDAQKKPWMGSVIKGTQKINCIHLSEGDHQNMDFNLKPIANRGIQIHIMNTPITNKGSTQYTWIYIQSPWGDKNVHLNFHSPITKNSYKNRLRQTPNWHYKNKLAKWVHKIEWFRQGHKTKIKVDFTDFNLHPTTKSGTQTMADSPEIKKNTTEPRRRPNHTCSILHIQNRLAGISTVPRRKEFRNTSPARLPAPRLKAKKIKLTENLKR